ncbi:uncharacterized protein LOC117116891 [Anneissia japonica]|uniref:uncharacterized protein LOC117116891 n=1 Tax=Anneissia japonica TaxID=1529436 RepID=UPI0014255537|nr:uncharacterized protein LOC117116891 [Anneissia japonica]
MKTCVVVLVLGLLVCAPTVYPNPLACYMECSTFCAKDIPGMSKPPVSAACSPCECPVRPLYCKSCNKICKNKTFMMMPVLPGCKPCKCPAAAPRTTSDPY